MISQYFTAPPKSTAQGSGFIYSSPITQSTLPQSAVQRVRYRTDKTLCLSEIVSNESDAAAVVTVAMTFSGVTQITVEEAQQRIASGEFTWL